MTTPTIQLPLPDLSGPVVPHPAIRTPDQRLRVFVSSTLKELAEERRAVSSAIRGLRLAPVMFELGARPHAPRDLYRAYLAQSDVFVGIYWQQYGWVAPTETVSGLEDEYLLAGDRPKLIYVKDAADREPRLTELLARLQADDRASYKRFSTAAELAELLADDLAVLLSERFAGTEQAGSRGLRSPRIPVPTTELVGREPEVSRLVELVSDPAVRLVTLVGPGGIGKTRLALEVAARLSATVPVDLDGVWFVDLAPLTDPSAVGAAIATALGVRPEGDTDVLDLVIERLQGRRVLLVLDNFEHLMPAAPDLARLLSASGHLTVLLTSRTVLRIRGEHEVVVAPLSIPTMADAVALVAQSAAVQLFVNRAREVRPGFALTPGNVAAVAELCRLLDGIPLALELAAAQLRLLTPAALLRRLGTRLDQPLDLAAGPVDLPRRQRTLRATVEWSYSLLSKPERTLLARLAVFSGAWTLESAEAVGAVDDDLDVFQVMSALVAQSLVSPDGRDADEPRFRMLDTVRAFAAERLAERGERDVMLRRLAAYLRRFASTAGSGLSGPENGYWTGRVDAELEDLRSVMRWAMQADDAETVVRLTAPLFSYWWKRGLLATMRPLAEQLAALPSAARMPPDAVALLLWARGMFRISMGHTAESEAYLEQLLAVATTLDDRRLRAHALTGLGIAAAQRPGSAAGELLAEAAEIFRELGDQWGLAFALSPSGQVALQGGDVSAATSMHAEALTAADLIDDDHLRAQVLDLLGLDALAGGDVVTARDHFASAAAVHLRLLDQEGAAYCIDGFAAVALSQGHPDIAARLLGASDRVRRLLGVAVWPAMQPMADAFQAGVALALGEATFRSATQAGALLSVADALNYGLAATAGASPAPAGTGTAAGLDASAVDRPRAGASPGPVSSAMH